MAATLSELQQQNPNIRSQIEVWQRERANNGQSPSDWEAFRQHAMAIGAPDPGQEAPQEFAQSASTAQSESASAKSNAAAQQIQPAPQEIQQAPQQVQQPQAQQPQIQVPQPQIQQGPQPQFQQPRDPAVLDAIRIKNEYEADKNTPTDKWLKARGMTKAQLDMALKLAESAESGR